MTANQAGDGPAALAASQRLELLVPQIDDPYLRAVSRLAMSWASMIVSDHDSAFRHASVALKELRRQDEPYWTTVAVLTVGYIDRDAGRYDDAFAHLSEAHELTERFGFSWLDTYTRVLLGTLAVLRGRLDEARAMLDQELAVSLPAYNIINITLSLAAFAQLAFAEGDPQRAALLSGAIDGLRRRAGLGVWPAPRRGETDLAAEIRQALGTDRFDQLYAAGARLSRREAAAAAARDQRTGTPAS